VANAQTSGEASQGMQPQGGKAPDAGKAMPAAKVPVKAPPLPLEPSLLDELLDNPYALGGIALVIVLLIGYALYAWRRKKQAAEHRFGPSFLGQGSLGAASSVLGMAGGQSVDTGTSSLQMDFSTGAHTSKAQAEEIDPVAEIDVSLAYGQDAQRF
jgi:pilus assembly protein FimV